MIKETPPAKGSAGRLNENVKLSITVALLLGAEINGAGVFPVADAGEAAKNEVINADANTMAIDL